MSAAISITSQLNGTFNKTRLENYETLKSIANRISSMLLANKAFLTSASPDDCKKLVPAFNKFILEFGAKRDTLFKDVITQLSIEMDRQIALNPNTPVVVLSTAEEITSQKHKALAYLVHGNLDGSYHEEEATAITSSLGSTYTETKAIYYGDRSVIDECLKETGKIRDELSLKLPSSTCTIL